MDASIPVSSMMKNVTCEITLTGLKIWKARLWVGILLFKFAVWAMGMKGTVKVGDSVLGEMK